MTAKAIQHALDAGLIEAGGSRSMWTILLALTRARWRTQHEIAQAVGIESPTMTHHLDGLEAAGLVARTRDPSDRRVIRVELTSAGEAMFERLQRTAGAFDLWLRTGSPRQTSTS